MPKLNPKATVPADALKSAVQRLRRAVPRGLNNAVLVKLTPDGLTFTAVGDGMWAETCVQPQDWSGEAQFVVVSPDRLMRLLESYRGEVEVSFGSKFRLKGTMDSEINASSIEPIFFQEPPFDGNYIDLPGDLCRTYYACGKKEVNQNVVWLLPGGAVTTNGEHSSALRGWNALTVATTIRIEMLARAMEDGAQLAVSEIAAMVKAPNLRAHFVTDQRKPPTLMGTLLNRDEPSVKFRANRADMRSLAQGQSVLAEGVTDTRNPLWLITRGGKVYIKSIGNQVGSGYAEVKDAEIIESNWLIAVSGTYLVGALAQCVGERVEIGMVGKNVLITDGTCVEHWMAPMNIGGDDGGIPEF